MQAHRIETTLSEDGTLVLNHLPFQAGEMVEVIVLKTIPKPQSAPRYPLRGKPFSYEDPTAPVALEDWEALK